MRFLFLLILAIAQPVIAEFNDGSVVAIDNPKIELPSLDRSQPHGLLYYDRGVWSTGYRHLRSFLREYGYSYDVINSDYIEAGKLDVDQHTFLIIPGGQSWTYLDDLGKPGGEAIKAYVAAGGGYIGICAGAFYAMSDREGGHTTGPYGIGLLEGVGYDGTLLGVAPFKHGMLDFAVSWQGIQNRLKIVLLEGPSILVDQHIAEAANMQVVARFPIINHPAMVLFDYGDGKVFLTGPHPEVEERWLGWGSDYVDTETDWPLLHAMIQAVMTQDSH